MTLIIIVHIITIAPPTVPQTIAIVLFFDDLSLLSLLSFSLFYS